MRSTLSSARLIFRESAAWLAAVLALGMAAAFSVEFAGQDVLHLSVRSHLADWYRIYPDTGLGIPEKEALANTLFPSAFHGEVPRVNLPLPPSTKRFQISLGDVPGSSISVARLCIERALLVSRCLEGTELAPYVEQSPESVIAVTQWGLLVTSFGHRPGLIFGPALLDRLRPRRSIPVALVRAVFAGAAASFFFLFFLALLRPVFTWATRSALVVFAIALAFRLAFFAFFQPGTVSDSALFLQYLQVHLFTLPGIRGLAYPAFLTLFDGRLTMVFLTQFVMGACGSVIVLLLLRSVKAPSRSDLFWALLATSWPTLLAMEGLILAESFCLFLLLTTALIFRWLQQHGPTAAGVAGLGAACGLLAHAKPQFVFVVLVYGTVLVWPAMWNPSGWQKRAYTLACFGAPVLALQLFALGLNVSRGNFLGTSSTLGYSLFDHGQQSLVCPNESPDPHIQYLCEARAALGPGAQPYAYTAWLIYPAMHRLQMPFPKVTEDYAALSFRLIRGHPALYARTVTESFFRFWTAEIPMVQGMLSSGRGRWSTALKPVMQIVIPIDRYGRDALALAFFVAVAAAPGWMPHAKGGVGPFCSLLALIALGSAILQALVESGGENARFEIPTEPLLIIVVAAAAAHGLQRPALLRYFI